MRYIGNKESITDEIISLLESKDLLGRDLTFFDAFSGTATVSAFLSNRFNIVFCDNMYSSFAYSWGRLKSSSCKFERLGFDPFDFFNGNDEVFCGFFSRNYAPSLSSRMYFSDFNAGRIDYFRKAIEDWKTQDKISDDEYYFLIASLLESVSKVANVAGVYGAYLKTWDPRSQKKIQFLKPPVYHDEKTKDVKGFYDDVEKIISSVDCDILYMDPPYTKNKYPVQYHILETLAKNDCPEIKGITGARDNSIISTDWSCHNKAEMNFEKLVASTKARYIVFSYSNDGLMSKDFITNVLKRYGKEETFELREINYKKYRNTKTQSNKEHFEYLFFIEKKPLEQVRYVCPLNYMGGKGTLIEEILNQIPPCNNFYDVFGGGFNVGINVTTAQNIIYNDYNFIVKNLIEMFRTEDTYSLLTYIEKTIKKFGLEKKNKEAFVNFRNEWNARLRFTKEKYKALYVLILFGFQQQLRFNSRHEFNNTVGESGYNDSVKEKIISFSRKIKDSSCAFYEKDFEELEDLIMPGDAVYLDPPYLITLGSYNDGKRGFKGWTKDDEIRLLNFMTRLIEKKCKIILSNVLVHKEQSNDLLDVWISEKKLKKFIFHTKGREEVLMVNE